MAGAGVPGASGSTPGDNWSKYGCAGIVVALIAAVGSITVAIISHSSAHGAATPSQTNTVLVSSSATDTASSAGNPGSPSPTPDAKLSAAEMTLFNTLSPAHIYLSTCKPFIDLEEHHGATAALECDANPPLGRQIGIASYPDTALLDEQGLGAYSGGRTGNGACARGGFSTGLWNESGSVRGNLVCIEVDGLYKIVAGFDQSADLVYVADPSAAKAYQWWYDYINEVFTN
jgi:hypothetical protein